MKSQDQFNQEIEKRAGEIGKRSSSCNDVTYRMWLMGQCLAGVDSIALGFDKTRMEIAEDLEKQVQAILYQLAMRELEEKPNDERG